MPEYHSTGSWGGWRMEKPLRKVLLISSATAYFFGNQLQQSLGCSYRSDTLFLEHVKNRGLDE
ncbi:hypothetical protein NXW94_30225 [Bacteroides ovatus]|nr:hypothetical protein [Bacteroides ovatus]